MLLMQSCTLSGFLVPYTAPTEEMVLSCYGRAVQSAGIFWSTSPITIGLVHANESFVGMRSRTNRPSFPELPRLDVQQGELAVADGTKGHVLLGSSEATTCIIAAFVHHSPPLASIAHFDASCCGPAALHSFSAVRLTAGCKQEKGSATFMV